ncbi:sulfite exporter TauE/SafE family protein [Flavobacterium sp.]|uniref:sulfite exporter TauE/SafE family protein n=1 Tax=Flavobacterium sp. TaxID=239 RepID=UPI00262C589C|nr:sulfite exporter TauE/SafE family protein [Flavobacterium sp.]
MEISQVIGYILAVFVGITLGLIGSGGSILSVPILVYIMGVEPILATAYSLFVVGTTALFGGVQKAKQKLVDFKKVVLFGIPTILAVFLTRKFIVPNLPDVIFSTTSFVLHKSVLIMVVFAIVMIFASVRMIQPLREKIVNDDTKLNYTSIFTQGLFIGLVAGFVGAGGGFLIIPALLFLAKTPMKMAVGTSLFIVSAQSLIGFIGDIRPEQNLNWNLILTFTVCSIIGVFIGSYLSKKIEGEKLKTCFGWFVLAMGIYIIIKEIILS